MIADVERRRLYDVLNVLETVEVVDKVAKNVYVWRGIAGVPSMLARLEVFFVSPFWSSLILTERVGGSKDTER